MLRCSEEIGTPHLVIFVELVLSCLVNIQLALFPYFLELISIYWVFEFAHHKV